MAPKIASWRQGLTLTFFLFVISSFGVKLYEGSLINYFLFDLCWLTVLASALCFSQTYVMFYLKIMLFMGFWIKFMAYLIFNVPLVEPTGYWAYQLPHDLYWDKALLISSIAALGIIIANLLIFFIYKDKDKNPTKKINVPSWYQLYHRLAWGFIFFVTLIVISINLYGHIYITGTLPQVILPWHFNAIVSWLMLFFIPFTMATFIGWDIALKENNKRLYYVITIAFIISISTLSRGLYLFLTLPYLLIYYQAIKPDNLFKLLKQNKKLIFYFVFCLVLSLMVVKLLRTNYYDSLLNDSQTQLNDSQTQPNDSRTQATSDAGSHDIDSKSQQIRLLFIGRWVGLEAVMATTTYPYSGWSFFKDGLMEKPSINDKKIGVFTRNVLELAHYRSAPTIRFSSLPGAIGILNYSNSLFVVFIGLLLICLLLSSAEYIAYLVLNSKFLLSQQALILSYWCVSGLNIPYIGLINLLECICYTLFLSLISIFLNWFIKYLKKNPATPSQIPA